MGNHHLDISSTLLFFIQISINKIINITVMHLSHDHLQHCNSNKNIFFYCLVEGVGVTHTSRHGSLVVTNCGTSKAKTKRSDTEITGGNKRDKARTKLDSAGWILKVNLCFSAFISFVRVKKKVLSHPM